MRSANQSSIPTDLTFVLGHSLIFDRLRLSVWLCREYIVYIHTYLRTRDLRYRIIIYHVSYIVVSVACKFKLRNISRQRASSPRSFTLDPRNFRSCTVLFAISFFTRSLRKDIPRTVAFCVCVVFFVPEKSVEFDDARRKGIWERGSKRSPTLIHIGETQTRGIHGGSFTMA